MKEQILSIILERSKNGLYTTQKEIRDILSSKGIKFSLRAIRKHISEIKGNDEYEFVIIGDLKFGYIVSDNVEIVENYIKNRNITVLKMLKNNYKDVKRLRNHKQLTFEEYIREVSVVL